MITSCYNIAVCVLPPIMQYYNTASAFPRPYSVHFSHLCTFPIIILYTFQVGKDKSETRLPKMTLKLTTFAYQFQKHWMLVNV